MARILNKRESGRAISDQRAVHFLGHRDDVAEILSRAQIFVLSSRWEGFPRSTLEAMRGDCRSWSRTSAAPPKR